MSDSKEVAKSSSDSDSGSDELDDSAVNSREKREVSCCCNPSPSHQGRRSLRLEWPPPSTSSGTWRNDLRHVQFGNRRYGQQMQLYCRNGYFLGIYHHHGVRGTQNENDLHTYLELVNAGQPGHVRIKGTATNAYVGMDRKGRLYTEFNMNEESTVFIESLRGLYNIYLSRKYAHLGWYIGIKKSGNFKRGPKTGYTQKAIQFLPRRAKFQ
ncbi:fibroblast growth factor 1-like [Coccinella septempunctata]|uniref:fibroblast growth factor 1-like n=1 Tax=Coccinella septempunctata TaxID=41139 RepID=UPI001D0710C3|nr:fibroblast growth factor 1-like [Coccinella septempunctata]